MRAAFDAAGYTDRGVAEVLGRTTQAELGPKRLAVLLRRTAGGSPLETLIRLFILGVTVPEQAARAALGDLADAAATGLVTSAAGDVRATVEIRCYRHLLVAFDRDGRRPDDVAADYVMGISPSTIGLAGLTVRRPNRTALDLGCGSGFQAFLAAGHTKRVTAVDLNPRAVALARFNCVLNGLTNVECIEGDLFQPVVGRRFDLVVSNPPFVISPERTHLYLHSGLEGDEVCATIVREAARFLEEGAFCQLLANWEIRAGRPWEERVASWFRGTGCDGWVMHQGTHSLDEYAVGWLEGGDADLTAWERAYDRWVAYYRNRGIEAIGSGLVTLRRRSAGDNWFRADDAPDDMTYPCGDDILRAFEAGNVLNGLTPDGLLEQRLVLAGDVRLVQEWAPAPQGWAPSRAHVHRTTGLQYRGAIDPHGAGILAGCTGERTLGELLAATAAEVGSDVAAIAERAVPVIRRMVEQGFLAVAGPD